MVAVNPRQFDWKPFEAVCVTNSGSQTFTHYLVCDVKSNRTLTFAMRLAFDVGIILHKHIIWFSAHNIQFKLWAICRPAVFTVSGSRDSCMVNINDIGLENVLLLDKHKSFLSCMLGHWLLTELITQCQRCQSTSRVTPTFAEVSRN